MADIPGTEEINERNGQESLHSQSFTDENEDRSPSSAPSLANMENQENMKMLMDVNLKLSVELGRSMLTVSQILDLQTGSVVELDRIAGEPVDIYVNDRKIARGDVVVVDDKFGVRVTELINSPE
ncbi:MAG: flagellar motor switch protein FliN [Anaerolineaceae bacterium]|nr:flagellar motor switch protein FliN [Anaerolineaceae bacterium]